jgi:3-oxoacyl-[acyl-carrier-protein] synthase II
MRRVVVTGLGMVTPLGCGVEVTWRRLIAGESGIRRIDKFEVADLPSQIAGAIPLGDGSDGTFAPDRWMEPKEQRKVDDFILFAMSAATQALEDAGCAPKTYEEQIAFGTMIGSGIGGVEGIAETSLVLNERGPRRVSPFFIPGRLINLASGYVSIAHGLKGPNHAVVTACSTGAHAIGDAARIIALGDAEAMVAGGTESPLNRISLAGFAALRALSTGFNDEPTRASRPYDRDRDGFVMGEGAGMLVLEDEESARERGATILGEVAGYGSTTDAHHLTAPEPTGGPASRAIELAIRDAGADASQIDYINAHGTSTQLNDAAETAALKLALGAEAKRIPISSTKSSIGHLLGAAGAVEAVATIRTLQTGVIAPTLGYEVPDPALDLDYVPGEARPLITGNGHPPLALSNSFAFGGHNVSLVIRGVKR